jgi:hypothetical protein
MNLQLDNLRTINGPANPGFKGQANMKAAKFAVLLGMLSILACATLQDGNAIGDVNSWKGKDFHQLMARLGSPQQETGDQQGGRILIYSKEETMVIPGMSITPYSVTQPNMAMTGTPGTPSSARTRVETYLFWVNPAGVIYRTERREG